jgi:plastocyanin
MHRLLLAAALVAFSTPAAAQGVTVTLSEWKMRLSQDTVPAGPVTIQVTNAGAMAHALQVVGPGVDKGTRQVAAREVATLTVTLKPGTYELYCPLAEGSHKMAGMTRTLVVTGAEAAPPPKKPGAGGA